MLGIRGICIQYCRQIVKSLSVIAFLMFYLSLKQQMAELIVNTVGYQGRLTFDTSKPDGTMRKLTDPGKLHALGWHHKIDIEEGVQRMYRWYLGK